MHPIVFIIIVVVVFGSSWIIHAYYLVSRIKDAEVIQCKIIDYRYSPFGLSRYSSNHYTVVEVIERGENREVEFKSIFYRSIRFNLGAKMEVYRIVINDEYEYFPVKHYSYSTAIWPIVILFFIVLAIGIPY